MAGNSAHQHFSWPAAMPQTKLAPQRGQRERFVVGAFAAAGSYSIGLFLAYPPVRLEGSGMSMPEPCPG
jgi:hypothetical protein